jgi:transposase
MPSRKAPAVSAKTLLAAARRGELDERQARQLYQLGPEAVRLVLMAVVRRIAEQDAQIARLQAQSMNTSGPSSAPSPSTPSGMVPVYEKPNRAKRRKGPGAREGHRGTRRARPARIDVRRVHRLVRCPDCGGSLKRCRRTRTRIIEDIPEDIQPVVTEYTIHRDYCATCKKHVEPVVPEALPHATLGHHVVSLSSWFHYGLGVTLDQIVDILGYHLQTRLTPGGLVHMWQRLAGILTPWYEQLATEARSASHLHADETGWRVAGQTQWLWCFANAQVCYYMIDRSRGGPALQQFFTESFEGVLITDFWRAYDGVCAEGRQFCLVHLLRELEKVDEKNTAEERSTAREWGAFAKRLRRLIRDGIRLRKRQDFTPARYRSRILRIDQRLCALADADYEDKDARRLAARLRRTRDHLWTFLDEPEVPFENNFAERMIRPAVILRKNSQSNRSEQGAATQATLMSIYRTLRLRGLNPTQTIAQALQTYVTTGELPPLPTTTTAIG